MARIILHLLLQEYSGGGEKDIEISGSASLNDLLLKIGVPEGEIGMVIKNGRWENTGCFVENGDTIELFPFLSGG